MKKINIILFSILIPLIIFIFSFLLAYFKQIYLSWLYPILFIIWPLFLIWFGIKKKIKFGNIIVPIIIFIVLMIITWGIFFIYFSNDIWEQNMRRTEPRELTPCVPIFGENGCESDNPYDKGQSSDPFHYDPNGPYPSPIVDAVNMINARGELVDKFVKGFFSSSIGDFEYKERFDLIKGDLRDYNDNAVNDCITKNCNIVFFEKAVGNEQKMVALFNDKDNPIVGQISDLKLYSNSKLVSILNMQNSDNYVVYIISYNNIKDNKVGIVEYKEDLCIGYKGGSFSCHEPEFNKNDTVFFFENTGPDSLRGHFLVNDIIKASLIKYQYYTSPDTGEKFPVVKYN